MNDQPNLQAILSDYGADRANAYKNLEQAAYSDEAEKLKREAIDAIYAGLLAEVPLDDKQKEALKRWCYGGSDA